MGKRFFCLGIVVMMMFSCLTVSFGYAEDDALSHETAVNVIQNATELRESIGFHFLWYQGGKSWITGISETDYVIMSRPYVIHYPEGPVTAYRNLKMIPVKEGYEPDRVKERIRTYYSEEYAQRIFSENSSFFEDYEEQDGKYYYCYYSGVQLDLYDRKPSIYFEDAEIEDTLKIEYADGENAIVSVGAHRNPIGGLAGHLLRVEDITITFFLKKEDGLWKVSGGNFDNMIFSENPSTGEAQEEFTEQIALEDITAAVYDLYYFRTLAPESQLLTSGIGSEVRDSVWHELEGNLASPETWKKYAGRYCSAEIAEKLLAFDRRLTLCDGKVFARGHVDLTNDAYEFDLKNVTAENLQIESCDDSTAAAIFLFTTGDAEKIPLHFTFAKEEGVWKISGGDFLMVLDGLYVDESETFEEYRVPETGDFPVWFATIPVLLIGLTLLRKKEAF